MTWQALTTTDHAQSGWTRFKSYQHAQNDALAPVLAAEIPQLLSSYALAFALKADPHNTTQQTTPDYQLVALLSLQAGLNLFLDADQQWQAAYVPAHYRSYPFNLLPNQQGELTLCFDTEADLIHTPAQPGQLPLLNQQQQPSEHLAPIIQFLQQRHQQSQVTQALVNQLAGQQLIQPWPLNSAGADGEEQPVKGLYRIDEQALKTLEPALLSELAQSGALALAYAQLFSQTRLQDFNHRFERHQHQQTSQTHDELDLDQVFGEADNDLFKF